MTKLPLGLRPDGNDNITLPITANYIYITDETDLLFLMKTLNAPNPVTKKPYTIFADVETGGLYIDLRLVQLYIPEYDLEHQYLLDIEYLTDYTEVIKSVISANHTVWHGGNYDLGTLNLNTIPYALDDTLYMSRLAFPLWPKYGLVDVDTQLGLNMYSKANIQKASIQKAKFKLGTLLSPEQLLYSSIDVLVLAHIYYHPEIHKVRHSKTYKLDILSLRYSSIYQQNPIQIDLDLIRSRIAEVEAEIHKNKVILVNDYNNLNVNSPKQCKEALGTTSSDKLTLITAIGNGVKLAQLIFDQRRLLKKLTMLKSYLHEEGLVTRYNPAGATTGRFTATGGDIPNGVNLQQVPRNLKDCFIASPGNKIVGADYPTIELRVIASVYPNVPNILKSINPRLRNSKTSCKIEAQVAPDTMYDTLKKGVDLHKATACALTGLAPEEIDAETRFKAKAVNFGLAFGMGPTAFQDYAYTSYGLTYSLKEATNVHKIYLKTYPEVNKAIKYTSTAMYSNRASFIVTTALGRLIKPRRLTDAINAMVQGSASEVMKLAIHYMYLEEPKVLNYIVWVIHDAIYLDAPEEAAKYYKTIVETNMVKAWVEIIKLAYFKYHDVPLEVEASIADNTKAI